LRRANRIDVEAEKELEKDLAEIGDRGERVR